MSSALFGNTSRSTSKNLVEFKAGKMYMQGKMVHPDKRKGLVYVYQADDTLLHFCWKDRTSGSVEEDLIVFPDDCEFKKVSQCTTGRVFVLRFKSNNRRLFFWMQEPSTDKDEEHLRKVNEHLNNPPTPGSGRSAASTPNPVLGGSADLPNLNSNELQNLIGNFSQHQLMQILGSGVPSLANLLGPNSGSGSRSSSSASSALGAIVSSSNSTSNTGSTPTTVSASSTTGGSTTSTTTTSSTARTTPATTGSSVTGSEDNRSLPIQLSDLQNILTGISVPPQATAPADREPVDLASSLTAETLQPILSNKDFIEKLKPFLPDTGDQIAPAEQLRGTVTSPQFRQAVNLFTAALQSGELGPLIMQFGLGDQAASAAVSSDMEAFIKALSVGKKEGESSSEKEKEKEKQKDQDKDQDDSMALD